MRFLSRLISALLSLVVIATVSAFILGATIWNPERLRTATDKAQVPAKVAETLPSLLKSSLGLNDDETFIIQTVATKERVTPYINQILDKLAKPDGQALQLSLNDMRRAIVAESLPLPAAIDTLTAKPFTAISAEQSTKLAAVKHLDDQAKLFGPIIAGVLIVLIVVLAKRSRFMVLGEAGIMVAIGLGLVGLILPTLPGILTSSIGTSAVAPLRDTLTAIAQGLLGVAQSFYYKSAFAALIIGLLCYIIHGVSGFLAKFAKKKHHA
jgi:hypothetical protein